jgi:hypothetical protein
MIVTKKVICFVRPFFQDTLTFNFILETANIVVNKTKNNPLNKTSATKNPLNKTSATKNPLNKTLAFPK